MFLFRWGLRAYSRAQSAHRNKNFVRYEKSAAQISTRTNLFGYAASNGEFDTPLSGAVYSISRWLQI